jgi:hypothetical protein
MVSSGIVNDGWNYVTFFGGARSVVGVGGYVAGFGGTCV